MSIVWSNGTLVKSDFTSNDTISCPAGMGSFFIRRMKFFVILMLRFESLNEDSTSDRCFANWYVAELMFDTMGLISRSSIISLTGNYVTLQFHKTFLWMNLLDIISCIHMGRALIWIFLVISVLLILMFL